jgi:phosphatidylserine decarboxylase
MNQALFIALQRLAPQHLISRAAGWLAESRNPRIKNTFIRQFVEQYHVDMSQAVEEDPTTYASFNDFFTRRLKDGMRPICANDLAIACPADGAISQLGTITQGRIFQAKGQSYSVTELLGGDATKAAAFSEGEFATVYLSPRDYHRVHMPFSGRLTSMTHVPGDLFSVNTATAEEVPRLFARNERVVCHFQTSFGPMVVVLVGAMIVASIETVWAGLVTPVKRRIRTTDYDGAPAEIYLNKGDEMGRFLLGSTAIVLFPKNTVRWNQNLTTTSPVLMGQEMGRLIGG